MDNLKPHSEYADQSQGPQENVLSFALPTGQVLDSDTIVQQHTNLSSFWFPLEQHRLQLDQVLQVHNEHLRVSLQQQISMQNATLLNLVESVTRDALMQVLDSGTIGQQHTSLSSFWFSLEQHRLHLDQVLQLHNEQLWVSLQQQLSMQNTTLLNLVESVTRDGLMEKNGEIANLRIELQKKQEDLETTLHDRDEWMKVAMAAYEINQTLIHMLCTMQLEANSHVSSNDLDAPSSRDEASVMARAAVATTQPNLICKVCNYGNACMLVLPCQHLCACKPCGAWLSTCPICGAVKTDAIEARFVYEK